MIPKTYETRPRLRYAAYGLMALVLALTLVGAAFASPSSDSKTKNQADAPLQVTPTATGTAAATSTATACANYVAAVGADTIVSGTVDTGNHCDDCVTTIALPFSYQLY